MSLNHLSPRGLVGLSSNVFLNLGKRFRLVSQNWNKLERHPKLRKMEPLSQHEQTVYFLFNRFAHSAEPSYLCLAARRCVGLFGGSIS